ncbi:hypothetical protein Plhal304r1_c015g0054871 [Plasmopara halstedii]
MNCESRFFDETTIFCGLIYWSLTVKVKIRSSRVAGFMKLMKPRAGKKPGFGIGNPCKDLMVPQSLSGAVDLHEIERRNVKIRQ